MAKTLTIIYKDEEYTLEYTRRTVKEMEAKGFIASELTEKPMTYLPQLFQGAFLAHHKFLVLRKADVIDEILDEIPGESRTELVSKLTEMYNEPIEELISGNKEGKEGNALWTANW